MVPFCGWDHLIHPVLPRNVHRKSDVKGKENCGKIFSKTAGVIALHYSKVVKRLKIQIQTFLDSFGLLTS